MSESNYTPVADGFHDCKIVFVERAQNHYYNPTKEMKPITAHIVLDMKLVPVDCPEIDNPSAYRAEVPIMLRTGYEFSFFDEDKKQDVWRKATSNDNKATIEYAKRCFPEWVKYCDGLPDGSIEEAIAWFSNRTLTEGVTVRAKLSYKGLNEKGYQKCYAKVYAPFEAKPVVAADELHQIGNSLKATGIKLFGGAKAKPAAAPAKPTPPKPAAKTVDQLMDEAWGNYQRTKSNEDPSGAKYYDACAEIVGKDKNTYETWTVAEWQKIVDTFDIPF